MVHRGLVRAGEGHMQLLTRLCQGVPDLSNHAVCQNRCNSVCQIRYHAVCQNRYHTVCQNRCHAVCQNRRHSASPGTGSQHHQMTVSDVRLSSETDPSVSSAVSVAGGRSRGHETHPSPWLVTLAVIKTRLSIEECNQVLYCLRMHRGEFICTLTGC